ncbi:MAG TPA: hypothetical protein PLB91_08200 [Spirochaetales bacterium]|nr:hypothetical protein [Spirochaetales bacterium]HRY53560.1 hypothetical protein [Spirochaetia bacterium]
MKRPRSPLVPLLAAGLLALAAFPPALQAQELRTLVAGIASLQAENAEGSRLAMGYDEAIAVTFAKDSPFIQGFEIELKLPPAISASPGAFAYELWRRVEPAPDKSRYGYKGERIITQSLPSRAGFVIQIPVRRDHGLKSGPYATLLPTVVEAKDFPFLFKLVPLAKGSSPAIEAARIQVRVRPLLGEEGGLKLLLKYPEAAGERDALVVTVDEKRIDPQATILLKAGPHRLHVSSELYRDENRSFVVEQGRILELALELQDTAPLLVIEAPDSALVLLDGVRIDHVARPQMAIEPGEHSVSCKIGDYSLSRKFSIARGKTYRLVLSVDLQVQEGP